MTFAGLLSYMFSSVESEVSKICHWNLTNSNPWCIITYTEYDNSNVFLKKTQFSDFTDGYKILSKSMHWVKSWKCSIYHPPIMHIYIESNFSHDLDFGFWTLGMLFWMIISIIDKDFSFTFFSQLVRSNISISQTN